MAQVKTSRLELLRLRVRRELVVRGISILTSKRDALLKEFKGAVEDVMSARTTLDDKLLAAERILAIARAMEPGHNLTTQALAAGRDISFDLSTKNVWGVKIPSIDMADLKRGPHERGSAPGFRSPAVDEAAGLFEDAIGALAKSAVAEARLLRVGSAIKNATRRVNALERKVEPQIRRDMNEIVNRLEEKGREETFRLKRYKRIKERV